MAENILRYPITDDHNYKGIVFFQTLRDTTEPLQYQNLGGNGSQEQDFNSPNTGVTDGSPVTYGDACILYLPSAIQISDAAVYDNVSLGALGAITEAALKQGSNIASAIATAGKDELKSFADGLMDGLGTTQAKLAGVRATSKLGDKISGAVKSTTRITTNPNVRAIFNQVPLREFSFTFKLVANSPKEALEIKKIIKYFRTELYPSDIMVGEGIRLSLGYHFPDMFRIEFHHPAEELTPGKWSPSQVATKLKDCYLTGFNAVYNATGMGLHKDGNFTEIDVTLSFREASTLSKKDIAKGY